MTSKRPVKNSAAKNGAAKNSADSVRRSRASKKGTASARAPFASKTAFVLSMPEDTPASEVVAKAKEHGLVMREKYVYNVRANHRARNGGSPAAAGIARRPSPRSAASLRALEAKFIDLALDIGFARAEELFAEIRAKLKRA
jgi:hypothetical protein